MGQRGGTEIDFADGLALAAAILWLAGTTVIALAADVSLVTALTRGFAGATVVYVVTFVGVHVMFRFAYTTSLRRRTAQKEFEPGTVPAPEQAPGPAAQQG
jgi:hypothetical protein